MAPHPGLDVGYIRDKARKDLLDLLEGVRGNKNLVIERALAGPIGIFCKASTLQQYGVQKFFFIENGNADSDTTTRNVIFLARGEKADRIIAITEQIKRLQMIKGIDYEISVILVPRRTLVSNKIFEDAGILGDISVEEYPLYFTALERDFLSLELDHSFQDLYLKKDPSTIFLAAKALMQMQHKFGLFPRIIGKGDQAQRLMELLLKMRAEASADETSTPGQLGMMPSSEIESLIVIDRDIDPLTPLLTQLTYEGFIDELYGIKDNQAEIDTSIVGSGPGGQSQSTNESRTSGPKRPIKLDSSDKLYEQMRDANFARVGGMLQQAARRMQADFGGAGGKVDTKSTSELKELVRKLPGYQQDQQSLGIHIGLTDDIGKHTRTEGFRQNLDVQQNLTQGADPSSQHDAIEELIARGSPLKTVLRLLCLESIAGGGMKEKDLQNFRTLVIQAYGSQHLLTLDALGKMGLLTSRSGGFAGLPVSTSSVGAAQKTNYSYLRKALKLIVDDINELEPTDIAYVFSGYAPLSVRLVQSIVQKSHLYAQVNRGSGAVNGVSSAVVGWQGFEDALKAVKGASFNKIQKGEESATKARSLLSGGSKKNVVVMFLGGITRAELAALRFLGQAEGSRNLLICTTQILAGDKMMDAAIERQTFAVNNAESNE